MWVWNRLNPYFYMVRDVSPSIYIYIYIIYICMCVWNRLNPYFYSRMKLSYTGSRYFVLEKVGAHF